MNFKALLISLSTLLTANASIANFDRNDQAAKQKLQSSISALQNMYNNKSVQFTGNSESVFLKTMMNLQSLASSASQLSAQNLDAVKLDNAIQKAQSVQNTLSTYLGKKDTFGYRLKHGTTPSGVNASEVYDELARRNPSLGLDRGKDLSMPDSKTVTQFNSLKTEFYTHLFEAAQYSKTDPRLKKLAEWGNDTEVIFPGKSFGEDILSTSQKWNLKLQ